MKTVLDARQLDLFGDLDRDDPLVVYYRRLRKAGCALHYDRAANRVLVWGACGTPAWAVLAMRPLRNRIIVDLLRLQYGVAPAVEREALDGGATLHRLPRRREIDPPVRHTLTGRRRQGPSAG